MKTAAIVIDDYKLETFRRHLHNANFKFTEHKGPTATTLTLKVQYEWLADLSPIVAAANKEASRK
jgi:hypothetical protein